MSVHIALDLHRTAADGQSRAGHAASVGEAFEKDLGDHCLAYVPHTGALPDEVVSLVRPITGVMTIGGTQAALERDEHDQFVGAGLDCVEAYHSGHDVDAESHDLTVANRRGLDCQRGPRGIQPGRGRCSTRVQLRLDEQKPRDKSACGDQSRSPRKARSTCRRLRRRRCG